MNGPVVFKLHLGPHSILKDVEQELLDFIELWHGNGLPVNHLGLMRKAQSLIPKLETKSEHAVKMYISHFKKKHRHHPSEVEGEVLQFLDYIHPILQDASRDPNYIMNMDQTPVFHMMDFKLTINHANMCTVNLHTSTSDSKRVMVAVTITASG